MNEKEKKIALELRFIKTPQNLIVENVYLEPNTLGCNKDFQAASVDSNIIFFIRKDKSYMVVHPESIDKIKSTLTAFVENNAFHGRQEVEKPLARMEFEDKGYRLHYLSSTGFPESVFITHMQSVALQALFEKDLPIYAPIEPKPMFESSWQKLKSIEDLSFEDLEDAVSCIDTSDIIEAIHDIKSANQSGVEIWIFRMRVK